jgi:CBS domain-containing protein
MDVNEIMTQDAECTRPDATIREAAERMKALGVGSLPVCDDERLVGMLTDRDIIVRSVSEGRDPKQTRVRDAMTPDVVYCFDDQSVEEAAEIMRKKQIRRLPVLNRDKDLVGILSLGDVAVETGNPQLAGSALESISEPAGPRR